MDKIVRNCRSAEHDVTSNTRNDRKTVTPLNLSKYY